MLKKLSILVALLFTSPAFAIDNYPALVGKGERLCFHQNLYNAVKNADVIFTGRFLESQNMGASLMVFGSERYKATFEAFEAFKGIEAGEQITLIIEDIYDYNFDKEEIYLVYGYNFYKDEYAILGCPRSEPAYLSNDKMEILRVPSAKKRISLKKQKYIAEKKGETFYSELDGPIYEKGNVVVNPIPEEEPKQIEPNNSIIEKQVVDQKPVKQNIEPVDPKNYEPSGIDLNGNYIEEENNLPPLEGEAFDQLPDIQPDTQIKQQQEEGEELNDNFDNLPPLEDEFAPLPPLEGGGDDLLPPPPLN